MSDSLFLDPFARPPAGEAVGSTAPAAGCDNSAQPGVRDSSGPDAEGRLSEPVSAVIALEAEQAVEAFLEYIHLWWPAVLRACGEDSHLGFEDGMLLEEGVAGDDHRWADVVGIDGAALSLRWWGGPWRTSSKPRPQSDTGAEITLGFSAVSADRTRVTVRGTGPSSWVEDWNCALGAYSRFVGGAEAAETPGTPAG